MLQLFHSKSTKLQETQDRYYFKTRKPNHHIVQDSIPPFLETTSCETLFLHLGRRRQLISDSARLDLSLNFFFLKNKWVLDVGGRHS